MDNLSVIVIATSDFTKYTFTLYFCHDEFLTVVREDDSYLTVSI
jgi:hypothetical protein